jgi:hypothetical protein
MTAEQDSGNRASHVRGKILGWDLPIRGLRGNQGNCVHDRARVAACQHVGTAFNSLGPFRHVANRHVWHVEDTGFLLNGAAIGNDAEGRLFQSYEIKESKRFASHQSGLVKRNSKSGRHRARPWMHGTNDRQPVSLMEPRKRVENALQALRDVHILGAVQRAVAILELAPRPCG